MINDTKMPHRKATSLYSEFTYYSDKKGSELKEIKTDASEMMLSSVTQGSECQ
jgi:hypothetical protein